MWKLLIPASEDLEAVCRVMPGDAFIDSDAKPSWTSLYMRGGGGWLSLSWDSQDVSFRFEIFCLSIDHPSSNGPRHPELAAKIPSFSEMKFLLRTTWLRPAIPGEVPPHFVQRVEGSGRALQIPVDYIEAGTTLDGIVLLDSAGRPTMAIVVTNTTDYLVSVLTENETITSRMDECDVMSLDEVLRWTPPGVE